MIKLGAKNIFKFLSPQSYRTIIFFRELFFIFTDAVKLNGIYSYMKNIIV